MLHDTIGFVELTELPANVAEGTIVYLSISYDDYVRGHYQYENGVWRPIGGGSQSGGGGNTTLIPTFRPAIGTIITNQVDRKDRLLCDGASYPSENFPVLSSMFNIGIPSTQDLQFSLGFVELMDAKLVGGKYYMLARVEASARELLVMNKDTLEIEERYNISTAALELVTDGNNFLIRTDNRRWALFDTSTSTVNDLGSFLQDQHNASVWTSPEPAAIIEIDGMLYIPIKVASGDRQNNIRVISKTATSWGNVAININESILGAVKYNNKMYLVTRTVSPYMFKSLDVNTEELTLIFSGRLVGSNSASLEGPMSLDSEFLYATTDSGKGVCRIALSEIDDPSLTADKWLQLSTSTSNSTFFHITMLDDYVVFHLREGTTRSLVFINKETWTEEKRFSGFSASPSLGPNGLFLPKLGFNSVSEKYSFASFSVPTIADVITGVPVLIQAR